MATNVSLALRFHATLQAEVFLGNTETKKATQNSAGLPSQMQEISAYACIERTSSKICASSKYRLVGNHFVCNGLAREPNNLNTKLSYDFHRENERAAGILNFEDLTNLVTSFVATSQDQTNHRTIQAFTEKTSSHLSAVCQSVRKVTSWKTFHSQYVLRNVGFFFHRPCSTTYDSNTTQRNAQEYKRHWGRLRPL